ncbi:hypothetical protein AUJ65_03600 [Candidatus Micrarchaeota archaeon CG1_02_51_15]|nr:MAG: hypothetical protein AUJ65_03600 [Candidatus Micrarchaeota archaeon CG1_02_51_15]
MTNRPSKLLNSDTEDTNERNSPHASPVFPARAVAANPANAENDSSSKSFQRPLARIYGFSKNFAKE